MMRNNAFSSVDCWWLWKETVSFRAYRWCLKWCNFSLMLAPNRLLHWPTALTNSISALLPSAENSSGLGLKPTSLSAPTHDSPPTTIEECNYLLTYLLTYLLIYLLTYILCRWRFVICLPMCRWGAASSRWSHRFHTLLLTGDNQFGFKKGIGCTHAINSCRNIVDHFVNSGSTVNICALDLSKAFDKVNHHALLSNLWEGIFQ